MIKKQPRMQTLENMTAKEDSLFSIGNSERLKRKIIKLRTGGTPIYYLTHKI